MGSQFPKSDLVLMEDFIWTTWSPKGQILSAMPVPVKADSVGTAMTELLLANAFYIATVFALCIPLCVVGTQAREH